MIQRRAREEMRAVKTMEGGCIWVDFLRRSWCEETPTRHKMLVWGQYQLCMRSRWAGVTMWDETKSTQNSAIREAPRSRLVSAQIAVEASLQLERGSPRPSALYPAALRVTTNFHWPKKAIKRPLCCVSRIVNGQKLKAESKAAKIA